MNLVGYSGKPLSEKLGLKPDLIWATLHAPEEYSQWISYPNPPAFAASQDYDFLHAFYTESSELEKEFLTLKQALKKTGILWISWPKKAAKTNTDLTEDTIRNLALAKGLVDVKVCAVSETWSGLKLVYRLADRN